jgi:phosphatidylserine/phosphatidylglycerophosphate/cardiolipin synthase-like enzyme
MSIGGVLIARRVPSCVQAIQRPGRVPLIKVPYGQVAAPQVYFSPQDNVRSVLIALIRSETEHIALASYVISDRTIVEELIAAHARKVKVEIVACRSGAKDAWSKVDMLINAGLPVYIYPAGFTRSIMHHKFALFFNRMVVATGSANWTKSGFEVNKENVVIQESPGLVARFAQEFEEIKRLSVRVRSLCGYKALIKRIRAACKKKRHPTTMHANA